VTYNGQSLGVKFNQGSKETIKHFKIVNNGNNYGCFIPVE